MFGLPQGLSRTLTRTSDTVVTLTLTGRANEHADSNDVNDLELHFFNGAFTGGDWRAVANSDKSDLTIDFIDPGTDITAPVLQSATVNGATLVLTYNENLDTGSVPAASAFGVQVAGVLRALAGTNPVAVSGSMVTLTLSSAVAPGEAVSVVYAAPATNPIQDVAGNDAGAISATQSVTNATPHASMAWAGGFTETVANDGTVEGSVTATLTGDTFVNNAATLTAATDVANLPNGFTGFTVTRTSATVATIMLTGSAASHASTDSVNDLTVTFGDAAFVDGGAVGVTDSSKSDLTIDFIDSAPAPDAPAAPTVERTAGSGSTSLDVSWTAPADNGTPINDYDLQYRPAAFCSDPSHTDEAACTGAGAAWTPAGAVQSPTLGGATQLTVASLTPATTYEVRVRAGSTAGDSAWSAWTAETTAPATPAAPTLVAGITELTVSWPAVTGATDHDLRYRQGTSGSWTNPTGRSTGTSDTITGLMPGTLYQVQIRTYKGPVGSGWSSPTSATTIDAAAPDAPAKPTVRATPGSRTSLDVTWRAPNDNGAPIIAYVVEYRAAGTGGSFTTFSGGVHVADDGTGSATLTGLTDGTRYEVRVAAANFVNPSPWSPSAFATAGRIVFSSPAAFTVKENHTRVGDVRAEDNDGHRIVAYRLSGPDARHFHNAFGRLVFKAAPDYENPRDAGGDNTYNVTVTAVSGTGDDEEEASQDIAVTVTNVDVPGQVASAPTFTRMTGSALRLEWPARPKMDGGDWITRYEARYSPPGPGLNNRGSTSDRYSKVRTAVPALRRDENPFALSITRLVPDTDYTVWVRAVNSEGAGPWSASAQARTAATPLAPRASVAAAGETAIRVSWTAPRDQGSAITEYSVLWGLDVPGGFTERAAVRRGADGTLPTEVTLENLEPGTRYKAQVMARNARGWGPYSPVAAASTGGAGDGAPGTGAGGGPALTGIALPQNPGADGWYATGDLVRIDVGFDGAIGPQSRSDTPDKATATPNLRMIVGTTERTVTDCFRLWRNGAYNALRCRYTVQAGDRDTDGLSFPENPLSLPPGAALHAKGDPAAPAALAFGAVAAIAEGRVNAGPGGGAPAGPLVRFEWRGEDGRWQALADGAALAPAPGWVEVRAVVGAGEQVGSVRFALAGPAPREHTDNTATFELWGGRGARLGAGQWTLRATPYAERDLGGTAGPALAVSFTVGADVTAPSLISAAVNGDRLALTYGEALDAGSVPAAGAFAVTVAGAPRSLAAANPVAVSGREVVLTLASPAARHEAVTVSYAVPASNPVRDAAGNAAQPFAGRAVANDTPADTTAPVLQSAAVRGATLVLTYDETLDTGSVPAGSAFAVLVGINVQALASTDPVAVSGSTVTLTLARAVTPAETVRVAYNVPAANPIRDLAGNAAAGISSGAVSNTTPTGPFIVWAGGFTEAAANDGSVEGSVTATLAGDTWAAEADIRAGTGSSLVNLPQGLSHTLTRTSDTVVTLTLSGTAAAHAHANDVGNLSLAFLDGAFAGGDANAVTDAQKHDITIDFIDPATTDTTAPALQSATVNGATLTLTYDENLDTGSVPAATEFAFVVDGTIEFPTAVAVSGMTVTLTLPSAVAYGQTAQMSYNVPATNPIQDVAGNAAAALTGQAVTNLTPGIAWAGGFTETAANDGTVEGSVTATLTGDTFISSVIQLVSLVDITNLPTGLGWTFSRDSDTQITFTTLASSSAGAHADGDDADDVTISFSDGAFTGGDASAVANSTKSDITVDFNDPGAGETRHPPQVPDARHRRLQRQAQPELRHDPVPGTEHPPGRDQDLQQRVAELDLEHEPAVEQPQAFDPRPRLGQHPQQRRRLRPGLRVGLADQHRDAGPERRAPRLRLGVGHARGDGLAGLLVRGEMAHGQAVAGGSRPGAAAAPGVGDDGQPPDSQTRPAPGGSDRAPCAERRAGAGPAEFLPELFLGREPQSVRRARVRLLAPAADRAGAVVALDDRGPVAGHRNADAPQRAAGRGGAAQSGLGRAGAVRAAPAAATALVRTGRVPRRGRDADGPRRVAQDVAVRSVRAVRSRAGRDWPSHGALTRPGKGCGYEAAIMRRRCRCASAAGSVQDLLAAAAGHNRPGRRETAVSRPRAAQLTLPAGRIRDRAAVR